MVREELCKDIVRPEGLGFLWNIEGISVLVCGPFSELVYVAFHIAV